MATKARSWTWRELVLRVRDVETGEQQIERSTVWAPPDEARRRTQLIEDTHRRHPDARFKSFAGSVASFVAGKHLVIARYGEAFDPPASERPPDGWEQKALFGDAVSRTAGGKECGTTGLAWAVLGRVDSPVAGCCHHAKAGVRTSFR